MFEIRRWLLLERCLYKTIVLVRVCFRRLNGSLAAGCLYEMCCIGSKGKDCASTWSLMRSCFSVLFLACQIMHDFLPWFLGRSPRIRLLTCDLGPRNYVTSSKVLMFLDKENSNKARTSAHLSLHEFERLGHELRHEDDFLEWRLPRIHYM